MVNQDWVKIYFDGGSRGNPGPSAGAAYTEFGGVHERALFLPSASNNEAEYRGLLLAIDLARELEMTRVAFLGDSRLVVMHVTGQWAVIHPKMEELNRQVLGKLAELAEWRMEWIPRESNHEADRIANEQMDTQLGIAPLPPLAGESLLMAIFATATAAMIRDDIAQLNQRGSQAGFGDLRALKVGGKDAFSRTTLLAFETSLVNFPSLQGFFQLRLDKDRLTGLLPEEDKTKLLLGAMRWAARGLLADLALRKVLVDLEMANKMRGKKG